MSLYDDVDREALHDWLDERDALRADAHPDRSEYEDPPETCWDCGCRVSAGDNVCPNCEADL